MAIVAGITFIEIVRSQFRFAEGQKEGTYVLKDHSHVLKKFWTPQRCHLHHELSWVWVRGRGRDEGGDGDGDGDGDSDGDGDGDVFGGGDGMEAEMGMEMETRMGMGMWIVISGP